MGVSHPAGVPPDQLAAWASALQQVNTVNTALVGREEELVKLTQRTRRAAARQSARPLPAPSPELEDILRSAVLILFGITIFVVGYA